MADNARSSSGDIDQTRRCIVQRAVLPPERMIRFVITPEGIVVPDLARKLPGRGIWLSARRDVVNTAVEGSLFAKAARHNVVAPEALADRIEELLVRRCLDFLGLARRAGQCVTGFEKVCEMLKAQRVGLILTARDAAEGGVAKVRAKAMNITMLDVLTSDEMGGALGRPSPCVYVAVAPGRLADSILNEAVRLSGFRFSETLPLAERKQMSVNGIRKNG